MNSDSDRPLPPRTVLLMDFLIRRLHLRAVPPFSFNAGFAIFAVAGGLFLPDWFGDLAGSLLEMQLLVIVTVVWLLTMLFARHATIVQAKVRNRDPKVVRGELQFLAWIFDFPFVIALLLSFKVGGPFGPLELTFLAGATVISGVSEAHDARELAELGARLLVAVIAVVAVAWGAHLPKDHHQWPGASGSIMAAGIYFGALALVEAAGIYPRLAKFLIESFEKIRARF